MAENGDRRYQDSLLPRISAAIDLGHWALRWRKLWSDDLEIRTGTVTEDPVDATDIANKAYVDAVGGGGGLSTVEAADGNPSYTGIDTLQFDEADGFVITNPSAGVARIDLPTVAAVITVREVDAVPSVASVTTLEFDQADGFVVTDATGGVARVDITAIPSANLQTVAIAQGGTGATTAGAARTALGSTATGDSLFTAASAAAARTTLDVPSNAEAILDTIVDAKGDLIAGTAADTVARLAVSATNGQALLADSAASTGLSYGDVVRVLDRVTANTTVNTTVTETTVYTFSVPANTLGTSRRLRLSVRGQGQCVSGTLTLRLKYGGTTLMAIVNGATTWGAGTTMWADFNVSADGATNSQVAHGVFIIASETTLNALPAGRGTAAIDSTAAATLLVSVEWSISNAANNWVTEHVVLEVV